MNDTSVREGIVKALSLPGLADYPELEVAENPDLATAAIVDLYTNLLEFALGQSFTDLQVQQLLLLLSDSIELIANVDTTTGIQRGEHPLNEVLFHFSRKLSRMCSAMSILVDERSVVTEVRDEEQIDPVAQAAYEARLAKAKKGQEKSVEPPPKVKVTVSEERELFTRKTIQVGPYFSPQDARTIVEYFDRSLFLHWRLVKHVSTQPREIEELRKDLYLEDVPTFLPPLSSALTLDDFTLLEQRIAVETEWLDECNAIKEAEALQRQALSIDASTNADTVRARDRAAREADLAGALSANEYAKTVSVLSVAVAAVTNKKLTSAGLVKRLERVEAAAASGQVIAAKDPSPQAPSPSAAAASATKKK